MHQTKLKAILHPVRLKIIQSLANGKSLTAQQISERIKDVPQATLYRQLNTLLEANILEIVQENHIRGTVEKVYALKEASLQTQDEILSLSKEQHLELFLTFTTQLIGLYENYLNHDEIDLLKDGVSYRIANLYVTDEEFKDLMLKIASLISDAAQNKPTPERKAKNIATIIIPE